MQLHPALNEADLAKRAAERQAERDRRSAEKAANKLRRLALSPAVHDTLCPVPAPVPRVRPQPVLVQHPAPPAPTVRVVWRFRWDDPLVILIGAALCMAAGYAWTAIRFAP